MHLLSQLLKQNNWLSLRARCHLRPYVTRSKKMKDIEREMGLPERPKRPPTAYNRFYKDTFVSMKDLKNKKPRELAREIAALWKQCDAIKLQAYREAFEKDQIEYRAKLAAYKSQITDAQLSALALEKLILMEEEDSKSDKKIQDANFKAMGRPKRPLPPFGVFCMNERQKLTEKISVTDLAAKWKATNADERKIYEDQAKKNSERYRQEMQKWKDSLKE